MQERMVRNTGAVSTDGHAQMGFYYGSCSATGVHTNGNFPVAIATAAPASSVFTVTHNLALVADSYLVLATALSTVEGSITITTHAANAFTATCFDESATPALADIPFDYLLIISSADQFIG